MPKLTTDGWRCSVCRSAWDSRGLAESCEGHHRAPRVRAACLVLLTDTRVDGRVRALGRDDKPTDRPDLAATFPDARSARHYLDSLSPIRSPELAGYLATVVPLSDAEPIRLPWAGEGAGEGAGVAVANDKAEEG
jgi:hypothetical protein